MKKLKLLFVACALLFSVGMQAQSWVPSEVGEGSFYLYNVGSEKYLTGGNSWGTHASIDDHGLYCTLTASEGGYSIATGNGQYLGTNGYVDSQTTPWIFTAVEGLENTYTISNSGFGGYLVATSGSTDLSKSEAAPTDNFGYWKLASRDALLAAADLDNASENNPVDVTFLLGGVNFVRNCDGFENNPGAKTKSIAGGWTYTVGGNNFAFCGPQGDKQTNTGCEMWNNTFDVNQTATVPNGKYYVTCDGFGSASTVIYANGSEKAFVMTGSVNSHNFANALLNIASYKEGGKSDVVTVSDNTIKVGVKRSVTNGEWTVIDNFRLYCVGKLDLSSLETALAEAIEAAKGISGTMNADVATALESAISTYDGKTYDNEGDYSTAISAVNTAVDNANTSIANYAEILAILNAASSLDAAGQASYAANETIAAIQAAYDNRTIESLTDTQKENAATALRTAAKAQTTEGADMTLAIVNPGIDGNANGWTTDINGNGGYAGGPMKPSNDAMEFWGAGTLTDQDKGKSFDYYQIIKDLPAGIYTISAYMLNSTNGEEGADWNGGGKAGLYGKTSTAEVKVLITTDGQDFVNYTTDEITVIDGELRIGVKNFESLTGRWFCVDNFKLTYVGPIQDLTPYVAAYETAKAAAETTSAKTDKMAASIRTELDATIAADVDQTSQEALVNATAALNAITAKAEKSIASYAIIATGVIPDNSLDGWVCENSNDFHINTWSTESGPVGDNTRETYDGTGMVVPFIENWVGKGSYLGAGKVYYKLEALEPGETYYAQALVRSYNEANADAPNGPDFFINGNVTKLSEEGNTFTYSGMSGIYATLEGFATVGTDGTLTLGIEIAENRNYNWVAFKNVKIQTLEAALADATTELGTAVDAATDAAATKSELLTTIAKAEDPTAADVTYADFIFGSEFAAFATSLAEANSVDATSIPAVRTAKANLEAATAAYIAAAPDYERAAMVIAIAPNYSIDVTELQAIVANESSTGEAVASAANGVMTTFATQALASSKANLAGFEVGEYAPYKNVEGMMAVATATQMGTNPANFTNEELYGTFSYLSTYTWTANEEEVNAFYKGDFDGYDEDTTTPLDYTPNGWTETANFRMMLKNAETYPGLADASATSAIMSWSGGITYGEQAGYEMPLAANTIYTLTFKAAGWNNESRSDITVSVLNGTDGLTETNLGTPDRDIKGNENNTAGMTSFRKNFITGAAGNYIFQVKSGNNFVITDLELKKAAPEGITITSFGAATYVSDNDLDFTNVTDFKVYKATVTGTTAKFTQVYKVPAGEGVLIEGTAGTYEIPVTIGVEAWADSDNEFIRGTGEAVPTDAGDGFKNYILSTGKNDENVGFYYAGGAIVPTNRAYLKSTAATESRLVMVFEGEATGIKTIDKVSESGALYNLNGARVAKPTKGLYIQDGKKVVIK